MQIRKMNFIPVHFGPKLTTNTTGAIDKWGDNGNLATLIPKTRWGTCDRRERESEKESEECGSKSRNS